VCGGSPFPISEIPLTALSEVPGRSSSIVFPGSGYIGAGRVGVCRPYARPISGRYNLGCERDEPLTSLGTGLMSPIRFRIRTFMIAIAAMAVVMGLLMNGCDAVATTIVFLAVSVLEISAYSFYLSRGRMRQ
jgi:hypothetical protein